MSNLVASQIMSHTDVGSRSSSIEKWVVVADICRCLNNYNGVLEITSALNRSAIYRLKKTWAKIGKQVRGWHCDIFSPSTCVMNSVKVWSCREQITD